MHRFLTGLVALALFLFAAPVASAAPAVGVTLTDLLAGVPGLLPELLFNLDPHIILAPLPAISITSIQDLFRPDRVAQVIVNTEAYGTPVLDRFYPESRRRFWPQVVVPLSRISRITRAVPMVLRGGSGINVQGGSGTNSWIEPQPIKTFAALSAAEYNNARLVSQDSVEMWADDKTQQHISTHRFSAESLAAQTLTGTVTYPIANDQGQVIDTFTVAFGTNETLTVQADWTASATKLSQIHDDLLKMKRQLMRKGHNPDRVVIGGGVFNALMDKVQAIGNEARIPARVDEDGAIRLGGFTLELFAGEYYHPGGPGGSPAAGYKKVVGDNEILMYASSAPWELLRVRLDLFDEMQATSPLSVITTLADDQGSINMFVQSKPFPIPVPDAVLRTDVTVT